MKGIEEMRRRADGRYAVEMVRREEWKVFETKAKADVERWDAEKPQN